jgi:hypothetical protein
VSCNITIVGNTYSGTIAINQYALNDVLLANPIAPVPLKSGTIYGGKPTPFVF